MFALQRSIAGVLRALFFGDAFLRRWVPRRDGALYMESAILDSDGTKSAS